MLVIAGRKRKTKNGIVVFYNSSAEKGDPRPNPKRGIKRKRK